MARRFVSWAIAAPLNPISTQVYSIVNSQSLSSPSPKQIAVLDVIWITTSVALLLGYARTLGDQAVLQAVVYALHVVVLGTGLGVYRSDLKNALYWAALIALLAFIAVAGGRLPNQAVAFGWGAVGAGCGALCGTRIPRSLWAGALASAGFGFLLMLACNVVLGQPISWLVQVDIVSAGLIGFILRPFIQFLQWFESRSRQPRVVLASWLTMCVVLGNFLVPILGGVQR